MAKRESKRASFLVQILKTQNATWQGTVTFLDENRQQAFRSLLELIKLVDSVVGPPGKAGQEEAGNDG